MLRIIAKNDFTPKLPSPLTFENNSFVQIRHEYKRTQSTKDTQEKVKLGHRRTQSYSTPETLAKNQAHRNEHLRKGLHNRSSSNIANTREYFAAPAYNEASLLERRESMRLSRQTDENKIQ